MIQKVACYTQGIGTSYWARIMFLLLVVLIAGYLVMHLPIIAQDLRYHDFVDSETWMSAKNASNVFSNAGFVFAGIFGLVRTRRLSYTTVSFIWRFFFCSIMFVGIGSSYYHWEPSNDTLLWDRLPMTLGFASLMAGVIAERLGLRAGSIAFIPLVVIGIYSVMYWWLTEKAGAGDLRLYLLVQYLPIILIPLMIFLFPKGSEYNRPYWILLMCYIIAKGFELQDGTIFAMTDHLVSGHTLKHLVSAAGIMMFKPMGYQ